MVDRPKEESGGSSRKHRKKVETKESPQNKFVNDGSFMEMFKRKMEEQNLQGDCSKSSALVGTEKSSVTEQNMTSGTAELKTPDSLPEKESVKDITKMESSEGRKKSVLSFVGKRRGGPKLLKTGVVEKKPRQDEVESQEKGDAWSHYLQEVQKYKSQMCGDEDQTRPLVK